MTNLGDPNRQRNVTRKAKDLKRLEETDLRWLLAQPQGRRYISKLLRYCGIEQTAIRGTPRETDMQLGAQLLGFKIRDELDRVDPGAYGQMRTELLTEDRDERRIATESKPDAGDSPDDEHGAAG